MAGWLFHKNLREMQAPKKYENAALEGNHP